MKLFRRKPRRPMVRIDTVGGYSSPPYNVDPMKLRPPPEGPASGYIPPRPDCTCDCHKPASERSG